MASFSHPSISSMSSSPGGGSCLQQRDLTPPSPYQCHMSRGIPNPTTIHHPHSSYDLGLSYGPRHSPCSPSQGYQLSGSYGGNVNSTGLWLFYHLYFLREFEGNSKGINRIGDPKGIRRESEDTPKGVKNGFNWAPKWNLKDNEVESEDNPKRVINGFVRVPKWNLKRIRRES